MAFASTYDELWTSAWGELQTIGPVHRHVQHDLLNVVRRLGVASVLDVGCGGGDNLATLSAGRGGFELTGADVSSEALRLAERRVPGAVFELLDVQTELLPRRFDLVMSVQVIEHLLDDVSALRNMTRMANRFVLVSTIAGKMRPSERAIGHVRNYSSVELVTKMESAGLEVLWLRGWGFPFYSPLVRSLSELVPGGPPVGTMSAAQRRAAGVLHALYRFNVRGRGDVITALGRPR